MCTFPFRYVTHEDIQQARLRRRRIKTGTSNAETIRSPNKHSNESVCNASEVGSSTSHSRSRPGSRRSSMGGGFGIDTRLLYDPLELSYLNRGGGSVGSFERFRVCRINTIAIISPKHRVIIRLVYSFSVKLHFDK